jgi:peptidyl-prolyl cis-trans isomerase A (cyclophilin A)
MNVKKRLVPWAAAMLAAGIILAGCTKSEPPAESTATQPPKTEAPAQPAAAPPAESKSALPTTSAAPTPASTQPARSSAKELLTPAKLKEKAPESYKVKFDTTRGEFTVTVTRAWAPLGADRFYNLVKHHFYDNAAFFRVVPQFVVQFGINASPAVSAAWKHTEIKDDPVTQSNKRGAIVFATAGPNTRTTQVFVNLKDNSRLDSMGFAPFGTVDGDGMNVVEMMYEGYGDSAGPDQDQLEKQGDPYLLKGWPKLDHIKSATVVGTAAAAQ